MKNQKRCLLYAWWTKKQDEVEARTYIPCTQELQYTQGFS